MKKIIISIIKDIRDTAHIKQVQDVIKKECSENSNYNKNISWVEQLKSSAKGWEDKSADEATAQKAEKKTKHRREKT